MKKYVIPFVSVLFYMVLFFVDGVQMSPDSASYLNSAHSREPLYPLFLSLFRAIFPGDFYLTVVVFVQCLLAAYAVYRLTAVLQKRFSLDNFSVAVVMVLQFAVVMLCRVVAVRKATYCNEICSEGIALPLFSLFLTELFLCIWDNKKKNILLCMLCAFALISTRKQMYIVVLIMGAVYFLLFVCRRMNFKRFLFALVTVIGSFGLSVGLDVLYNFSIRGEAMRHTTDSSAMVIMTMYCSDSEAADRFEDEKLRALYLDIMTEIEEKEYSFRYATGDWLDRYSHYSNHYDAIAFGIVNPNFDTFLENNYDLTANEKAKKFDDINKEFLSALLPVSYGEIFTVAGYNMLVGLFNTISKAYRILTPYNLLLILAYIGLMIYAIRKKERDLYWLAIATMISVCVNVVVVGFLIFAQTRYMIYNMPFVYIAGFLMVRWAWLIFLGTRKQKHAQGEKTKVAFHLNCLEQGGAERVVTTLANSLVNHGYDVYIATEWVAENEFVIDGRIHRVHVGLSKEQDKTTRARQFFMRIKNLRRFMKEVEPDVLIAFAKKANYRALMAKRGTKVPVIISVRTDPNKNYTGRLDRLLVKLLYPGASGNVFQTTGAREFFGKKIQEKSRIILNPINEKYLNVKGPKARRNVVVQSGRLTKAKNQKMLIEAFVKVHEKHPEFELEIYGDDSRDGTKQILENTIVELQAQSYVHLMGACDELQNQIRDAAVFAFSSSWEGLPNSLMEAMALGLPVVATDCPCGGPATLIRNEENGLLVPMQDTEAMASGILRLIEDGALAQKLGEEAARIAEIANPEAICKQWMAYIEEM